MRKRTGNRCASYIYNELFHHHLLAIDNIDAGARKVIYLAACQVVDARLSLLASIQDFNSCSLRIINLESEGQRVIHQTL